MKKGEINQLSDRARDLALLVSEFESQEAGDILQAAEAAVLEAAAVLLNKISREVERGHRASSLYR